MTNPSDQPLDMSGDTPVEPGITKSEVEQGDERPVLDTAGKSYDLTEFTLFTLAPIYWMVGVPFDITSEFVKSVSDPVKHMKLGLPKKIIDVPGWESVIEAIETRYFDQFANFMGQCVFQKSGQMSAVCGDYVDLPYALCGRTRIAVFTPRGLTFRFLPGLGPLGQVVLYQAAPDGVGKLGDVMSGMEGVINAGNDKQA